MYSVHTVYIVIIVIVQHVLNEKVLVDVSLNVSITSKRDLTSYVIRTYMDMDNTSEVQVQVGR